MLLGTINIRYKYKLLKYFLYIIILLTNYVLSSNYQCPEQCKCDRTLTQIDCSHNKLQLFPQYYPSHVKWLDFSHNKIAVISDSIQYDMHLNYLNISHNVLRHFPNWNNILILDLSYNRLNIPHIPEGNNIISVYLSHNPIYHWYYTPKSSIENLYLSNCLLQSIPWHSININLTNLRKLSLSGNPLRILQDPSSQSLEILDVSNAGLLTISNITKLTKLQQLIISNNEALNDLSHLSSDTLEVLDASFCSIFDIPTLYLKNLLVLHLRNNLITAVPVEIFRFNQKLMKLDLSNNMITYISSGGFYGATALVNLDLSGNLISFFKQSDFIVIPHLEKLNVSGNPITNFGNISASSLKILDASHCNIEEISPNLLDRLYQIEKLDLSENRLKQLFFNIKPLHSSSLVYLDLSGNKLKSLTFGLVPSLRYLKLSENMFSEMSQFIHGYHRYGQNRLMIEIEGNPWRCDCSDQDFELFYANIGVTLSPNFICQEPFYYRRLTWKQACIHEKQDGNIKSSVSIQKIPHPTWIPMSMIALSLFLIVLILLLIRIRRPIWLRSQTSQESVPDNEVITGRREELLSRLPSYEEALLLPKPKYMQCQIRDSKTDNSHQKKKKEYTNEERKKIVKTILGCKPDSINRSNEIKKEVGPSQLNISAPESTDFCETSDSAEDVNKPGCSYSVEIKQNSNVLRSNYYDSSDLSSTDEEINQENNQCVSDEDNYNKDQDSLKSIYDNSTGEVRNYSSQNDEDRYEGKINKYKDLPPPYNMISNDKIRQQSYTTDYNKKN